MLTTIIVIALTCICAAASESCNEEISGHNGTIVSPGYPIQPYEDNLDCFYQITTSLDTSITINIVNMSVENNFDYIEIYDGPTNDSNSLGHYTGALTGLYIHTSTNEALVYFHTDYAIEDQGFYIYFEESDNNTCPPNRYPGDSGVIESPLYPSAYSGNTDCDYNIQTSLNTQVIFHIENLDVELSSDCVKDFLEIFDGPSTSSTSLGKLCGPGPFNDIISSTNEAFVYFHSDGDTEGPGFNIYYSTAACTGPIEYNGDFGTIYSPGYPTSNYPPYSNCNYSVVTPAGSQVLLFVIIVDLEDIPECPFDSLRIYDGSDNSAPQLALLCSSNSSLSFQASTNEAFIEFRSDFSLNYRGFAITYAATYYYDDEKEELDSK